MLNNKSVTNIFEDLHKIPELSYNEFKTTKYIIEYLSNFELEIHKLEPTGIIAIKRTNINNNALVFRADIDALPLESENNKKAIHSCGHDGHTSMLLSFISKIFDKQENKQIKQNYDKNLIFIFQPAEEVDGGARIVLNSGILDEFNVQGFFGMHLWPEIDSGIVGIKKNSLMGTNFVFDIVIKGKSAHVSTPQNAIDSTQILADLIQSANYIIAKINSPFEPVVINFGKIKGGVAPNIIIETINIEGTLRASNDKSLEKIVKNLKNVIKSLELKYGCTIDIIQKEITYPAVMNNENLFNKIAEDFSENKNMDYVILENPSLACEDFGFYTQKFPAMFLFLGTQSDKHTNMLHSVDFDFDLAILEKGVNLYERLLRIFK